MQPAPQDIQLMSKHCVLGFKPHLRLERRGQHGQNETEQPDHSASLGDSITSSTSDKVFGTHSGIGFISGMTYNACTGYTHPLDGCSVDFGDHGILRDQVPSPWRELFGEMDEPLTFDLDRPDQDSPSASDAKVVAR